MLLSDHEIVLFQGDSVTDCGRDYLDPASLGNGYANLIASRLGYLYPEKELRFFNRGISGNRVVDLQNRWEEDCLALKPTWVSILIGINDTWRRYDQGDETTVERYEAGYRDVLERTKEQLGAKLILMEPFVLPTPEDRLNWRSDLDPKIQVVRRLAEEFEALLVPLDGLFAGAVSQADPTYWAPDGVHPSAAGHALMAEAWLRAIKAI